MITPALHAHMNTRDDTPFRFLGLPTLLRASAQTTGGAFGLIEQSLPAGFASPYHVHRNEDEAFYVLDGEFAFVCDGTWLQAGPGSYVFGPRNVPHGFRVTRGPARMLLLCAPAGFEQFAIDLSEPEPAPGVTPAPPDMGRLVATAAKYSIDILGPLPE